MTVYIGSASSDENGGARGGEAGNQSGRELRKQAWHLSKKGWRVFRAKSASVAKRIADDMRFAIANKNIGYDQDQRNTLYNLASKVGFDCSKVNTPCECDCSSLVRVCLAYAGVRLPDFNTASEAVRLIASGDFTELTDAKYTEQSAYLREGDILVTKEKGHTAVVLNDGSKAEKPEPEKPEPEKPASGYVFKRLLKYGSYGDDVVELKKLLIAHGYHDGITVDTKNSKRFASSTRKLVKEFQRANGLKIDGIAGEHTITALGGVWDG